MYANKSHTTGVLKANIGYAIGQIQSDLCAAGMETLKFRMCSIQKSRGGHLNDGIYQAEAAVV